VENRGNAVAMEIARINCSHCSTCSRRMETVTSLVHRAGLVVGWEQRGGGYFIVIPNPQGLDPIQHLRTILGLHIKRC
jgi:D-arabinose 1-dehydrogenase-like Zn-dependent alcohol dehydrogenase